MPASAVSYAMPESPGPLALATLRHMRHMSAPGSSTDLVTRPGKCSDKLGPGSVICECFLEIV